MTSDLDVYRSAHDLIQQHGEGAAIQAAMKADAMLDKGDLDSAAVWRQIVAAINELQRKEPAVGERRTCRGPERRASRGSRRPGPYPRRHKPGKRNYVLREHLPSDPGGYQCS